MLFLHSKKADVDKTGRNAMLALVALLLLLALPGCGGGAIAYDGGHIPIGGGSVVAIAGIAFDAENVSQPVAGATVTVTNLSQTSVSPQVALTGSNGVFAISVPESLATSTFQIVVTPAAISDRQSQQVTFTVSRSVPVSAMIAMPAKTFDITTVSRVQVISSAYSVQTGSTVQVNAVLLDAAGQVLPEVPSLIFSGSSGGIQPNGLFTSTAAGTGTVSAYWYTGVSQLSSTSQITVSTASTISPPAPPVAPGKSAR